ncbi:MAG: hypothetical protein GY719_31710, partial [bacterium]|nr:hypothetical protein [bacterium]
MDLGAVPFQEEFFESLVAEALDHVSSAAPCFTGVNNRATCNSKALKAPGSPDAAVDQIKEIALQTVEGHLRAIIGTLTVEEIYRNRDQFASSVQDVAVSDLANMGVEIVSFTLKDIRDNHGYLDALGKPKTAEVKRDAVIAQAEADRDAAIRSAQARRAGEVAKLEATVKRLADAERYRVETEAAAQKSKSELEATGQAEAARQKGKAQADVIRFTGVSEAEVVSVKGTAEAEAMAKKASSFKQYNEAAVLDILIR